MQSDERAIGVIRAQIDAIGKGEAQCCDMRSKRIIGAFHIFEPVGTARLDAKVLIPTPIAVGPAIVGAEFDAGHIIGNEIAAQHVAFVHRGPQRARYGFIGKAVGVAQAGCEDAEALFRGIDLKHRSAVHFLVHPALADIARRPDRHIEAFAVFGGEQIAGPVIIATRQIDDLGALGRDAGFTFLVRKSDNRVGVGDVKRLADQRHAEGRVEALQENRTLVGNAIAIAVTQQRDAVGRAGAGTGPAHQHTHHPIGDAVLHARRRIGFGNEQIAIGQQIHPARMIELVGKGVDRQPLGGGGHGALFPAHGLGNVHQREAFPIGHRNFGLRAGNGFHRQLCGLALADKIDGACENREQHERDDDDRLFHAATICPRVVRSSVTGPRDRLICPRRYSLSAARLGGCSRKWVTRR